MTTLNDIITSAQSLSPAERATLISRLWDSLSPDDWPRPSAEWIEASNARSAAYDAGETTGSPWDEVRQRARRQAGLDG